MSQPHNTEAEHINEQVVDVEEYSKQKMKIPESGVIYFINIEGHKYKVPKAKITGKELLELAGKTPVEEYYLLQMFADGSKKEIKPTDVVDLSTFGVEKFNVICKTNTDGNTEEITEGKRDFPVPLFDEEFLNSLGLKWETISSHSQNRVVIYKWPIIAGYNIKEVDIALLIGKAYPEAQIDMAHFKPFLTRLDLKGINASTPSQIGGEAWQQWSRHRLASNPWRSGVDDISTHLIYVQHWLTAELKKG